MLEVVDHQQDRPVPEEGGQRREGVLARLLAHADDPGDGGHDERRIDQRGQVDEPDAVREALGDLLRSGNRQAGLADAAGTSQGEETDLLADSRTARRASSSSRSISRVGCGGRWTGMGDVAEVAMVSRLWRAGRVVTKQEADAGGTSGHHAGAKVPQRCHLRIYRW